MNAFKTGTNTASHYLQGKEPSGFTQWYIFSRNMGDGDRCPSI